MTVKWCPSCREETSIERHGRCCWCDTKLKPIPKKRGLPPKISDDQLRQLHGAYQRGMTLRQLGDKIWEFYNFASPKSAANSLCEGFKRLHLPTRDRRELTAKRNFKHGRYAEDRNAAKRHQNRVNGTVRDERCNSVRQQYPNKGAQCQNMAMRGSQFCWAHDPNRVKQRDAILEDARSRLV